MFSKLTAFVGLLVVASGPAFSQVSTGAGSVTPLPGTTTQAPAGISPGTNVTPPPGVSDPMATNSTTGTVDHEDHCQPPGTPTNTNPSAETLTVPRAAPACN